MTALLNSTASGFTMRGVADEWVRRDASVSWMGPLALRVLVNIKGWKPAAVATMIFGTDKPSKVWANMGAPAQTVYSTLFGGDGARRDAIGRMGRDEALDLVETAIAAHCTALGLVLNAKGRFNRDEYLPLAMYVSKADIPVTSEEEEAAIKAAADEKAKATEAARKAKEEAEFEEKYQARKALEAAPAPTPEADNVVPLTTPEVTEAPCPVVAALDAFSGLTIEGQNTFMVALVEALDDADVNYLSSLLTAKMTGQALAA